MDEIDTAIARFTAALARLERAASRVEGREDAVRAQAAAIARLKRENEALRAAQNEETRLRNETLEQVDRAMEAVERALAHGGRRAEYDRAGSFGVDRDADVDRAASRRAAVAEAARAVDPGLFRDEPPAGVAAEDEWDDDPVDRPSGRGGRDQDRMSSAA